MDEKGAGGDLEGKAIPKRQLIEKASEDEDSDTGDVTTGAADRAEVKRPRRNEDPELDSDESDDSESSEEEMDLNEDTLDEEDDAEMTNLIVDFEGLPPVDEDVGAVEALVGQLFRGIPISASQLARLIVQNDHLSTLLKDQDAEEPSTYGVVSVVNCSKPFNEAHLEVALQFRDLVLHGIDEHYEREGIQGDIPEILKTFTVETTKPTVNMFGLVVIEKMVNIPSPAVWELLNTLKDDISIEGTNYTHFFVMTKFYRAGDEVFPFEEYYESLQSVCSFHIDYPLPKDTDTIPHNGQVGIPFRRLLVVPAPNFYQTVASSLS